MPRLHRDISLTPLGDDAPSSHAFSLSVRSFENLVALANDQERWQGVQKVAKAAVWRDRGEPPIPLGTLKLCLRHAAMGGLRASFLAGAIRAGVNVFLLLFRIIRAPRKFRTSLVLRAIFGTDTFRFSAMLGTFAFVYKFLLNSLPLLPIPTQLAFLLEPSYKSKAKRSHSIISSAESEPGSSGYVTPSSTLLPVHHNQSGTTSASGPSLTPSHLSMNGEINYLRLGGARWHAVLAGALAGLGVMWEKKERRVTIAQQLFVRGLQGSWNAWSPRLGINIPYGTELMFGLCCGQIMYAFILRPETIPNSYNNWIQKASKVPKETVLINRALVRRGTFRLEDMEKLISWPKTTAANRIVLQQLYDNVKQTGMAGTDHGPCEVIHPWITSCIPVQSDRFVNVFTWMFPIYGALHLIPTLLFKRKLFLKEPLKMLWRSLKGTVRSSMFLSVFVFIYQSILCLKNQIHENPLSSQYLPRSIRHALVSRGSFWVLGALTGFSLFVEEKRRRAELMMYVLPRGLESAWSVLRNRGWVGIIPFGESILCSIGMGMVMSTYQHDPEHLSGLVRRVLYQFIGPN